MEYGNNQKKKGNRRKPEGKSKLKICVSIGHDG
jgi:hypothetical protein